MDDVKFIEISFTLDENGLVWHPEIGDEIVNRDRLDKVSILVDPQGLTPLELRNNFLWLPTVEQLVEQFEARQAFIYHAGINGELAYDAVIRTAIGMIEASAESLRLAFGKALCDLLENIPSSSIH